MKRIISLLVGIIYVVGTSSMFHVFAMDHIHDHIIDKVVHPVWMDHATPHHATIASSSCGESNKWMHVCALIESSKTTILPSNFIFDSIIYYHYILLSTFLPPVEIIEIDKPYENFTIRKTHFSSLIVWIIKLTI